MPARPPVTIVPAQVSDAALLSRLAGQTFRESHGHSAAPADIDAYEAAKYKEAELERELSDPNNIYHLVYYEGEPAGFSKIQLNSPYKGAAQSNLAKLDRIYVLRAWYDKGLGKTLFQFLVSLMKDAGQAGTWLYTWKENHRAIAFYERQGFRIIGSHDFFLSPTHSNPNWQMLLLF
ncbi:GNAT family N-acetyltransferase [Flaviaesturariibacter flavus]|uniref:GNAT family N-acetyltransferase n=1 Tax=Flaviaesturariibacter flavus TaxID=2502780 RepID=A0A4R1B4T6_9BACT|nr:GNAT family N-acetyltransferase [Flaviaesturariibacter flavus]TCJ13124.1 GNAT family N-acetyltransferase [Flaviaesturariibacter flavus]